MGVHFDHDEATNGSESNPENSESTSGLALFGMLKKSQAKVEKDPAKLKSKVIYCFNSNIFP